MIASNQVIEHQRCLPICFWSKIFFSFYIVRQIFPFNSVKVKETNMMEVVYNLQLLFQYFPLAIFWFICTVTLLLPKPNGATWIYSKIVKPNNFYSPQFKMSRTPLFPLLLALLTLLPLALSLHFGQPRPQHLATDAQLAALRDQQGAF
jgi:hypothetical protein